MRCPTCEAEGLSSRVHIGTTTADRAPTPTQVTRYYTPGGKFHLHDPTITVQHYSCSNGHEWTYEEQNRCPAGDYPKE